MSRTRLASLAVVVALVGSACGAGSATDEAKLVDGLVPGRVSRPTATSASSTTQVTPSVATTNPPAVEPAGDVGTRENPIAMGELVPIGDWLVRIVSAVPDAADRLLSEDDFLDPPESGNVFFLVELEGIYVGDGSAAMWGEFLFNAVGADNLAYDEFGASCGFIDGSLSNQGEVFPGGETQGYQCFEVSAGDAETLTIYLESIFSAGDDDRVYLALRDGVGSTTGVSAPDISGPAEGDSVGSRANPVAIGSFAQVGDWFIRFENVDFDATDRILDAGQFNGPPEPGSAYVLAKIDVTYIGNESESFWFGLTWTGVGSDNVALSPFDSTCGQLANEMGSGTEFFPNGSASGEICLAVPEDNLDDFVFFFDSTDGDRKFFAITDGQGAPTQETVPVVDVDLGTGTGSRGNRIPFGSPAMVGDWEVVVVAFDQDATELVLAENPFNESPEVGDVFVLVDLEVTYLGEESSNFWADFSWLILGPDLVAKSSFDASCGSFPNDFSFTGEVFAGGTTTGSLCFEVAESGVDELLLIIDDFSTFGPEGRIFFDLSGKN